MSKTFELTIEKRSQRQLNPAIVKKQVSKVIGRAISGDRKRQGWTFAGKVANPEPIKDGEFYIYKIPLPFKRKSTRVVAAEVVERQFKNLSVIAAGSCNSKGWYLSGEELAPELLEKKVPAEVKVEVKSVGRANEVVVPDDLDAYFENIFDRSAQIGIIGQAIRAAVQSKFQNRNHCVLYGPPACGKSEILLTFKKVLGADFVLQFDATSTTEAGAKKELRELAQIPPILIVEEIEKTDEKSLRWLLGVLDARGEIRGLNYRTGVFQRDVKLLCLATVNDMAKFKSAMDGALASRFSNKIRCPRPSREVLERILQREVLKAHGRPEWIKPALDYCVEQEKTDDPRRAIAVALCGQDRLLTGEYQRWLAATSETGK